MSFLTLDLNLLRVFDAIMTEQNLSRAAGLLATTQPAVSNALKRLRDALNDELFLRTAHGVKPTHYAEELWPTVRHALAALEAAITPETFDLKRAHMTFQLTMADATAALWLPELVRTMDEVAPHLNIRMVPLTTRDPRQMLLRGDVDLALGFFPGVSEQIAGGQATGASPILHERLYTGEYVCVMHRNHPLAAPGQLTLDAYCHARHLLVSFSGRAHGLIDEQLTAMGRKRRIVLTVNQFFTAGRIVASSDLLTVLPRHLIDATGMTDVLVARELPVHTPEVNVDMLWHVRDGRNPAHQWLRKHLAMTVQKRLCTLGTLTSSQHISELAPKPIGHRQQ